MTFDKRRLMTHRNWALALALLPVLALAGCALTPNAHSRQAPATVTATATPDLPIILNDTLAENTNGWTDDLHRCFFQYDGYHVINGMSCYAPTSPTGAETVSVQATPTKGGDSYVYGVQIWQQPSEKLNCYAFLLDISGHWAFVKTVNDQDTALADFTANAAIKTGLQATNTLEVRASAGHIVLFVNGTRVGQVDDTTFTRGFTGLHGDSDGEVAFSNLIIKGSDTSKLLPPGNLTFQDPLTSDLGNLPSGDQSTDFEADGYHIRASVMAPYAYRDFGDADIQVTLKQLKGGSGSGGGIGFRHARAGDAYFFIISASGRAVFVREVNYRFIAVQEFHPTLCLRRGLGATNTLEVRATGTHFAFFINGTQVGEADDSTYASGTPGLINIGGETVFSDFYLSEQS